MEKTKQKKITYTQLFAVEIRNQFDILFMRIQVKRKNTKKEKYKIENKFIGKKNCKFHQFDQRIRQRSNEDEDDDEEKKNRNKSVNCILNTRLIFHLASIKI